jgi:hypothetical protein
MSWNRKHRLFSSFNCDSKRSTSQKDSSGMRSVESTRNQTAPLRSFGRDISNIPDSKNNLPDALPSHSKFLAKPALMHQVIYGKENTNESYHQKRLIGKEDSSERAKRAASVSNGQSSKQFLSKRGSNTLKSLSKPNVTFELPKTYLPNLKFKSSNDRL